MKLTTYSSIGTEQGRGGVPQKSESGIALIMVLIVTTVLGILAAVFAYHMKVETKLARNASFDAEIELVGRSGINLARWYLAMPASGPNGMMLGNVDCLNQPWAGGICDSNSPTLEFPLKGLEVCGGTADITIVDLDRKFNINTIPPDLLRSILTTTIGIDADWADTIAASVQDWRDLDDDRTPNGTESDDYAINPNPGFPPYMAKNGNIDDMSELLMIRGVTPAIYWGAAYASHWRPPQRRGALSHLDEPTYAVGLVDLFTAVGGGRVDVNTADAQVLECIIPDPNMVQECIIRRRAGPDGVEGTEDDTPFRSSGEIGCPFMGPGMGVPPAAVPPGTRPGMRVGAPGMMPGAMPGMTPAGPNMNPMTQFMQLFDTVSTMFEVTVQAKAGDRSRTYVALVRRNRGNRKDVQIMYMYWK